MPPCEERFPHLYRALAAEEIEAVRPVAELLAPPRKVSLAGALASFDERWAPRIVAELNGQQVEVAKREGAFP